MHCTDYEAISFLKLKWIFSITKQSTDSIILSQVDQVFLWLSRVKWLSLSFLVRKGKQHQLFSIFQERKTENLWPFPTVGWFAQRQSIIEAVPEQQCYRTDWLRDESTIHVEKRCSGHKNLRAFKREYFICSIHICSLYSSTHTYPLSALRHPCLPHLAGLENLHSGSTHLGRLQLYLPHIYCVSICNSWVYSWLFFKLGLILWHTQQCIRWSNEACECMKWTRKRSLWQTRGVR